MVDRTRQVINALNDDVELTVKRLAATALQILVRATPVDTGRARSNWLVGVGVRKDSVIEAYFPGDFGSSAGPNANRAIQVGTQEISQVDGINNAVFLSNNLPYIEALNSGSSQQAPRNFVQTAIDQAIQAVNNAS